MFTKNIIKVSSKIGVYSIVINNGALAAAPDSLSAIGLSNVDTSKIVAIVDSNTKKIGEEFLRALNVNLDQLIEIEPGEQSKDLKTAEQLWQKLLSFGFGRKTIVAAIGGGVIGDIAGFAAGTFMRGVPLIQVPTTLLAQVDSSIGGKVGIDLEEGKNLVGLFYPPCGVIVDPLVLNTLRETELKSGFVEILKAALLTSKEFWQTLTVLPEITATELAPYIFGALQVKAEVVTEDEFEVEGKRILLNLGHSIGHAIECGADFKGITHGQAVAIGILLEQKISADLNKHETNPELFDQILGVFSKFKLLPERLPSHFNFERALVALRADKKAVAETIRLPVLLDIAAPQVVEVDKDALSRALKLEALLSLLVLPA